MKTQKSPFFLLIIVTSLSLPFGIPVTATKPANSTKQEETDPRLISALTEAAATLGWTIDVRGIDRNHAIAYYNHDYRENCSVINEMEIYEATGDPDLGLPPGEYYNENASMTWWNEKITFNGLPAILSSGGDKVDGQRIIYAQWVYWEMGVYQFSVRDDLYYDYDECTMTANAMPIAETLYQSAVKYGLDKDGTMDADLCANVTCNPVCAGSMSLYDGQCNPETGTCDYLSTEECPSGCDQATGRCIMYDLEVKDIRLIQAIEGDYKKGTEVKLAAYQPTLVRVYLYWPDPTKEIPVDVTLSMDGEIISTQRFLVKNQYTRDDRVNYRDTVNFHVPYMKLIPGNHSFSVNAILTNLHTYTEDIQDVNPDNNIRTLNNQYFIHTRAINLLLYSPIDLKQQPLMLFAYMKKAIPYLEDVYPVRSVNVLRYLWSYGSPEGIDQWLASTAIVGFWLEHLPTVLSLKKQRLLYNSQEGITGAKVDYAVAVFPDGYFGEGDYGVSMKGMRREVLVVAGDKSESGHESIAHEIGHHILGSTEEYEVYGQPGRYLERDSVIYHSQTRELEDLSVSGANYFNFMGSAGFNPAWVNQETWNRLVDGYSLEGSTGQHPGRGMLMPIPAQEEQRGPGFMISGAVTQDGDVYVDSLLWLDNLSEEPMLETESGFSIEVVGLQGEPLAIIPMDLDFDYTTVAVFAIPVLISRESVGRINIVYQGEVMWQVEPTANPPAVSIDMPGDGSEISGSVEFRWSAVDADGDDLSYVLFYSSDGGSTWLPLNSGLSTPSMTVNVDELPGCAQCLLRVLASDGWHTTSATLSAPFSVAMKPPLAAIISPRDGSTLTENDAITLLGMAYDPEDGLMEESVYLWQSSIDGNLGEGRRVELASLSPGEHKITLFVQDSSANQAMDSVQVSVSGESVPPPPPEGWKFDEWGIWGVLGICGVGVCGAAGLAGIVLLLRRPSRRKSPTTQYPPTSSADRKGQQKPQPQVLNVQAVPPGLFLMMVSGPQVGLSYPLSAPFIRIGRSPGNDLVIDDKSVSNHHASLAYQGGVYILSDMGSANGTYVNGRRLEAPQAIYPGDTIAFGSGPSYQFRSG